MIFQSKLPKPCLPNSDVFNFIFHHGRRSYPFNRVLYRMDGTDESLTLAQLEERSRRLASVLVSSYDIKPGNCVSIFASDAINYPIAFFGALAAGATVALIPIQKDVSDLDIAARLEQAGTRLFITDREWLPLAEVASVLAGTVPIITLDEADPYTPSMEKLLARGDPNFDGFRLDKAEQTQTQEAFLNRTSGSTGKMKSVITTHAHYIATLETTRLTMPSNTDPDKDVWLSPLSLGFFINAKLHMSLNILLGIPVILMKKPFQPSNVDALERHRITFLFITPPIAAQFAKAEVKADVSSLKWLLSAGAPMHANLRQAVSEKFGGIHLTLEWASSETMLIAIQIDEKSAVPGSSGTLVNGMEAKVIDVETGEELGEHEEGEILVRNSLARFAGYKNNDIANKDFDSEGWYHTGDYGYFDSACNVFITDRLKELIRVGDGYGSRISASELEAVLFEHPAVASVTVVGIKNQETQIDQPTAFVVLQPAYMGKATLQLAQDIENFAASKLTGLKRLSGGVFFIPRNPTIGFKVDRRRLKGLLDRGINGVEGQKLIDV